MQRLSSSCARAVQVCAARGVRCAPARGFAGKASGATFFTKEHEYARVEGSTAVCGVSNYAQAALGDVVFVSLPQVGAVFKKGCVGPSGHGTAARAAARGVAHFSRARHLSPLIAPLPTHRAAR